MSFFPTQNSNRRIKRGGTKRQQSLLEVTARPDREQRRQGRRKLGGAMKAVLWVCLAVAGVLGGRVLVQRLVWENPAYAIDDIRVTTDGLLTRAQVLEIMEIQDGKNIFSVDLPKAKKALDLLPQVERAELRRVLPSRVDVRISERQPVAWVAPSADTELGLDGKAFLVDTRGYVMRTRKLLPEHMSLPVLTGVVMEDVAPGQKLPTAEALAAVELIKLSAEDVRWQPRVVDVSKGYCLLVTDQRKARVTFGFDNIEGQLARLRQIMDYVEPSQKEFQSVNLMLERSVPIVFAPPPPPAPPVDSKSSKGKGGKPTAQSVGAGVSGGPVSGGASGSAAKAASGSAVAPSAVVPSGTGGSSTPASAPVPTPEPPSPFKLARLTNAPASQPSERPPAPKPKRAPVAKKVEDPEEDSAPPRKVQKPAPPAPKVERVERVEKTEDKKPAGRDLADGRPEKARSAPTAPVKESRLREERSDGASLPPSESLRKLFNPHG